MFMKKSSSQTDIFLSMLDRFASWIVAAVSFKTQWFVKPKRELSRIGLASLVVVVVKNGNDEWDGGGVDGGIVGETSNGVVGVQ